MYGPSARLANTYRPSSLESVVRTAPVAVCVTLISTPGMIAPLSSRTVPAICAVACAHTVPQKRNKQQTDSKPERMKSPFGELDECTRVPFSRRRFYIQAVELTKGVMTKLTKWCCLGVRFDANLYSGTTICKSSAANPSKCGP